MQRMYTSAEILSALAAAKEAGLTDIPDMHGLQTYFVEGFMDAVEGRDGERASATQEPTPNLYAELFYNLGWMVAPRKSA